MSRNENYYNSRAYFLKNDERCKVWDSLGITWVLHHRDPSWRHDDIERYEQWNIEDLLPMTISAHTTIHSIGNKYNLGRHHSSETRRKISRALTGRVVSSSTRKRLSKSHLGKTYGVRKDGGGFTGHKHTEDWRQKMSESMTGEGNPNYGKHLSEETRRKISEALSGENNINYGKPMSEGQKKRISETKKGSHHSEETRRKMKESAKGRHWYNNGVVETLNTECPEGFCPGRLGGSR